MNESDFIGHVRTLMQSEDKIAAIDAIAVLPLPENASPLVVLIHGDCEQYHSMDDYVTEYDNATGEKLRDFRQRLSERIFIKLKGYLDDWDNGDIYRYSFGLEYLLCGLESGSQNIEYIAVTKNRIDAETITEAVAIAKEWQSHLLERIVLYEGQERGHKGGDPVRLTYRIHNKNRDMIADGTLEFMSERGISSHFGTFGIGV